MGQSLRERFAAWYGKPENDVRYLRGEDRQVDGVWFYRNPEGGWYTRGTESWIEMPADVVEGIKSGKYGPKTEGSR